ATTSVRDAQAMLPLFATPKTTPTFPSSTGCVIQDRQYCGAHETPLQKSARSPRRLLALKRGSRHDLFLALMSTRVALIFASFVTLSVSFAQEASPPAPPLAAAGSPGAASPAGTTPPLSASVTPVPSTGAPQLTDVLFKNLKARSIGPAVMGGRVSDIAIDPRNPFVFYVALGHGGVFKSGDSGVSFDPIFDKQPVLSIGAIAIAPSDSDVIWVGSGEANDRNSSDWGDGVYRTTDGGEHWA